MSKFSKTTKVAAAVLSTAMVANAILPASTVLAEEGRADKVNSVLKASQKRITVKYKTSTGMDKGQENVFVAPDTTIISTDLLKNVPAGFKVVDTVKVDGRFATAIVEPIGEEVTPTPAFRYIRVEYKNIAGGIVDSRRVKVDYGKLTFIAQAPEGYELVDTNNVISIDDGTKSLSIEVREKVAPQYSSIQVRYVTSTGSVKGTQRITVEKNRLVLSEAELTRVPEGYKVVDLGNMIKNNQVEVVVAPIEEEKIVTVSYVCDDFKVGEESVLVASDATVVDEAALNLPEGYDLVSVANITTHNACKVTVKKQKKSVVVSYETSTGSVKGTQRISVDFDALLVQESALTRVPEGYKIVDLGGMIKGNKVVVIVEAEEANEKEVKVLYMNGKNKVTEEIVTVAKDATTVEEAALTIPAGYKLVSVGNINSRNVVKVALENTMKSVVVKYQTSTGSVKGTQRIQVSKDALEIKEDLLTRIPEGYKVVAISGIEDGTVIATVEAIPTTKLVKVSYVFEGNKIGEGEATVAIDATTVTEADLTNVPAGYKVSTISNINSHGFVKVELERKTKSVVVKYETTSGIEKFRERVTVDIDALEIQESALNVPEGYKVLSISGIEGKTVIVTVEALPTTKLVKVNYVFEGTKLGEGEATVAIDATTVAAEDLTNVPEGFEVASISNINSHGSVTVKLNKKVTYKDVKVIYFVDGAKLTTGTATVKSDATTVTAEDLTDIPEGYEFASAYNISTGNTVRVNLNKVVTYKDVKVVYFVNNERLTTGQATVKSDATTVTEADLTDIPEGYNFVNATNINSQGIVRVNLEKEVTYKDVQVLYFYNNEKFLTETIKVESDATTVTADQLNIPEGYTFDSAYNISTRNTVRVNLNKKVTYKTVKVVYFYKTTKVGEENVMIESEDTYIHDESILHIPAGYTLINSTNVTNKGTVRANVDITYKDVKAVFFTKDGKKVGNTLTIRVPFNATQVSADEVTAPEGYEIVSVGNINSKDTFKVTVQPVSKPEGPKAATMSVEEDSMSFVARIIAQLKAFLSSLNF